MTGHPSQTRKPFDAAPYASLRQADSVGKTARLGPDALTGKDSSNDFNAEAERLKALREALWSAFEAGPDAGLPNTLIDLTMAYTGSLRLQLNLRAIASRHLAPKPRMHVQSRPMPDAKD